MKFKKSQSGRSMVEMLGVLAIIGVLSVGGIAGYSLSMRRHRANQVVDLTSKYALIVFNTCQQKMINNLEVTQGSYLTDLDDCSDHYYKNAFPTFENADIGTLPAGISTNGISFVEVNERENGDGYDVVVSTKYIDQKLCQAVASVVGSECKNSEVIVNIKQN